MQKKRKGKGSTVKPSGKNMPMLGRRGRNWCRSHKSWVGRVGGVRGGEGRGINMRLCGRCQKTEFGKQDTVKLLLRFRTRRIAVANRSHRISPKKSWARHASRNFPHLLMLLLLLTPKTKYTITGHLFRATSPPRSYLLLHDDKNHTITGQRRSAFPLLFRNAEDIFIERP